MVAAGKAAADFAPVQRDGGGGWRENQKLCSWCQIATLISAATLAVSLSEAARALRGPDRATAH